MPDLASSAALSGEQLTALSNLGRKKAGEDVDWINIAAARALTELGLAERDHTGWKITDAGVAALEAQDTGDAAKGPGGASDPVRLR